MAKQPIATQITDKEMVAAADAVAFRRNLRFWAIAAIALIALLFLFRDILLPFVAGLVLAYFLDPVADRLERLGFSRVWATTIILVGFVAIVLIALVVIIPVIASQVAAFAANIPQYLGTLQKLIQEFNPTWLKERFGVDPANLQDAVNSALKSSLGVFTSVFTSIVSSASALFSVAGLFVVTPVVTFYMLLDWDRMVAEVDSWVPRKHVETVRQIARDINAATAGFVRGQGTVCLLLGAIYAGGLTLVGLNFAILVGLIAGIISFIPYVGSMVGLAVAIGLAFAQFWPDWQWIVATACVFFAGQFIEGNILQPKLVGRSVGVHPVWLMFALFAFGAMFGFVGLLIAVPASAAIGVIVRFALSRYLKSPMYLDDQPVGGIVDVQRVEVVALPPKPAGKPRQAPKTRAKKAAAR